MYGDIQVPARFKQHPKTVLEKPCSSGWKSTNQQQFKPREAGREYGGGRDLPQGLATFSAGFPFDFPGKPFVQLHHNFESLLNE